jgi:uncharacterized protein YyaL (SSP411 family)
MANLLKNEDSPYLKQHINDLIYWHPWNDATLNKAKLEDKPIFLSIGYSSCHWCHVMQKESFNNPKIAKFINEHFIAIKVDKEERPDIDRHYQELFIKMNNKPGGWPLSIFLMPNLTPIYSATYLPPTPMQGLMGFLELLKIINKNYKENKNLLEQKGKEILDALKPKSKIEATKITLDLIKIATSQIKQVYDKNYGGFGDAPKFPHSYTLNLAINLYKLTGDKELLEIVTNTLNNIFKGGIYDIIQSGLCRYSTTADWLIPHFEKMSYDNALIIETLVNAYKVTNSNIYKKIAIDIANFLIEYLSKNNLFFSAIDADSNEIEGDYYIFSYNEVKDEFIKNNLDLELLKRLNITKDGVFLGQNIPRVNDINELEDKNIIKAIEILKKIRSKKSFPFIDEKIITSQNAMIISALFKLSSIEPKFFNIAQNSLEALKSKMVNNLEIYHSALIDKKPKIEGFLEDYAWYVKALFSYYEVSLDEMAIIEATNFINEAIKKFYKNGLWIVGNLDFKDFSQDSDASTPSAIAIMVENLLNLRSLAEPIYEKFAFKTLEVNSYNLMRQPISRPTLTNQAIRYIKDDVIIKSNEQNLKNLINFNFKYPYTLLKPLNAESFELCTNKACFASFKSLNELKEHI